MPVVCIEVGGKAAQPDPHGAALRAQIKDFLKVDPGETRVHHLYWLSGAMSDEQIARIASELLADPVVEEFALGGTLAEGRLPQTLAYAVKPGVTDPVAEAVAMGIADLGIDSVRGVVTGTQVCFANALPAEALTRVGSKLLFNPTIQRTLRPADDPFVSPAPVAARVETVPIRTLADEALIALSRTGLLALSLPEMQRIQAHYRALDRDPTDGELETIAQTWSEHCVHKTLKGRYVLADRTYDNLLKETIFAATQQLAKEWCISVFEDNAGVVAFAPGHHVCFKVETHNHPSAVEPYGGAGTGIGGVIRDVLGTGLGAMPIANTDVFCFADPQTPAAELPEGVLAPRRIMHGVVAGVRDYGNRMGIPTINGALVFDPGFLTNPLVFCGTVGLLPADRVHKAATPGDRIACIGGATGRDGIHGATFSSLALDALSETSAQGAVQIGNPIMEKQVLDALMLAREAGLYTCITDCGAGGLSSAIGEMGQALGARVHLERVPLKYAGLQPWEIWVSEAQERMVCAVPPAQWEAFAAIMAREGVPCTDLGHFGHEGRLEVTYDALTVVDLPMAFLHQELPKLTFHPVIRSRETDATPPAPSDLKTAVLQLLAHPTIASQSWVVRQYDHEVQGRSALKPLVGPGGEGSGDAAVLRPLDDLDAGIVLANGLCPRQGRLNAYRMTINAVDEALRNAVAVGADPSRIALLDNFAWNSVSTPEDQGDLVQAAEACRDASLAYGAPFISGKDSLHNEYHAGGRHYAIPPTMLISALGYIPDVRRAVSSDLKHPTHVLYHLGPIAPGWGGALYAELAGMGGGQVPALDLAAAAEWYRLLHAAIQNGWIRACHDVSDGGLLIALIEMALGGGWGLRLDFTQLMRQQRCDLTTACFAEAPGRLVVEVAPEDGPRLEAHFAGRDCVAVGQVDVRPQVRLYEPSQLELLMLDLSAAREAWLGFSKTQGLPIPVRTFPSQEAHA